MSLFKVTNKRLILNNGQRIEAGISAEVQFNGGTLPLVNSSVRTELARQFKVKYNIDFPTGYMNNGALEVTKL